MRIYSKVALARYDFSRQGGAIGVIPLQSLRRASVIPNGAIVIGGTIDIITQPVGASATLALGTHAGSSASSIKAATAIASWTVGQLAMVPLFTAATYFKMTADGAIILTVATTALTAGTFEVHVLYLMPNQ
jgi:hypothetical protein